MSNICCMLKRLQVDLLTQTKALPDVVPSPCRSLRRNADWARDYLQCNHATVNPFRKAHTKKCVLMHIILIDRACVRCSKKIWDG